MPITLSARKNEKLEISTFILINLSQNIRLPYFRQDEFKSFVICDENNDDKKSYRSLQHTLTLHHSNFLNPFDKCQIKGQHKMINDSQL